MQGLVRRVIELMLPDEERRYAIGGASFKLLKGTATVEFFKQGSSIGIAESIQAGDQLSDLDFDAIRIRNETGTYTQLEFYILSGKFSSDRLFSVAQVSPNHEYLINKPGRMFGRSISNPTAAKRSSLMVCSSNSTPYATAPLVISSIYVSQPCRAWCEFGLTHALFSALSVAALTTAGGVSLGELDPATGLGYIGTGEAAASWPASGIFLNGEVKFHQPIFIRNGDALFIQTEAQADLRVNVGFIQDYFLVV